MSRTGYVTTVVDCHVLCLSKLQSETFLSTMEAEVAVLAHSCRRILPIIEVVTFLGNTVGLQKIL